MVNSFTFCLVVFVICADGAYGGFNREAPDWPRLNVRALGMGGAFAALSDDESAIFHNPAGLGKLNRVRIGTSHSMRHFKGEKENLDQLDCDPTVIIYPMRLGTYAAGFTLQGELGYDYMERNSEIFPKERLWGWERYDGYGIEITPLTYFGFTHRTNEYDFNDGSNDWHEASWRKRGEGGSIGIIQTILPGIDYGYYHHRLDYDYDDGRSGRTKGDVHGLNISPCAWIDLSWQWEKIKYIWRDRDSDTITTPKFKSSGGEIRFGDFAKYRWGDFQGHKTWGYSWKFLWFESHRAYVDDMLPMMIEGYPDEFTDYKSKGFSVEF